MRLPWSPWSPGRRRPVQWAPGRPWCCCCRDNDSVRLRSAWSNETLRTTCTRMLSIGRRRRLGRLRRLPNRPRTWIPTWTTTRIPTWTTTVALRNGARALTVTAAAIPVSLGCSDPCWCLDTVCWVCEACVYWVCTWSDRWWGPTTLRYVNRERRAGRRLRRFRRLHNSRVGGRENCDPAGSHAIGTAAATGGGLLPIDDHHDPVAPECV